MRARYREYPELWFLREQRKVTLIPMLVSSANTNWVETTLAITSVVNTESKYAAIIFRTILIINISTLFAGSLLLNYSRNMSFAVRFEKY